MTHLTTEELLLQCDGELGFERALHLAECGKCRVALAETTSALEAATRELRSTIPPEPADNLIHSRLRLDQSLYPSPKSAGFRLHWPAVYAAAAALTFAVFGGYISNRAVSPDSAPALARFQESLEPAPPSGASQLPRARDLPLPSMALPEIPMQAPSPADGLPITAALELPDQRPVPERFALPRQVSPRPSAPLSPGFPAPQFTIKQAHTAAALDLMPPPLASRTDVTLLASAPAHSREATAALIEGYWILTEAGVWREDVRPAWRADGLRFEGAAEDAAAARQVAAAIERVAGPEAAPVELRVRQRPGRIFETERRVARRVDSPPGGAVRSSLVAHFADAARRSFQSPDPWVLDAEIERYVSEIFRGQSLLLAHTYALERLFAAVEWEHVSGLGEQARRKLLEVADFHAGAIERQEARIYDNLSEGLPRRFWSYRAGERDRTTRGDWRAESASLLRDTLELETTLTALLSMPQPMIDVADSNLSCGELLHRIRTRVRHLKAGADNLR